MWTPDEYQNYLRTGKKPMDGNAKEPEKKNKYGNKRTQVDDEKFDSQKEAKRWGELKLRHKAKEITKPIRQYAFIVSEGIEYVADFVYFEYATNSWIVEDAKGAITPIFELKQKMMKSRNNLEIKLT